MCYFRTVGENPRLDTGALGGRVFLVSAAGMRATTSQHPFQGECGVYVSAT